MDAFAATFLGLAWTAVFLAPLGEAFLAEVFLAVVAFLVVGFLVVGTDLAVVDFAVDMTVLAGQNNRPARRANTIRAETILEKHSLIGDTVKVRRFVDFTAIAA